MNILHVFPDDKFFDRVSSTFDQIAGIKNIYVFYTSDKKYQFKYIKSYEKVRIETNRQKYLKLFSDQDIDIIFLHSLSNYYYEFVLKADSSKIIIWWAWGYELYQTNLIKLDLYKPLTKKAISKLQNQKSQSEESIESVLKMLLNKTKMILRLKRNSFIRSKVFSKIDYFIPVLPIEYDLISKNKYFNAKLLMERGVFRDIDESKFSLYVPSAEGNILLGNSATFTNNHLDIIGQLKDVNIQNRKIIVPLNYGVNKYAELIKNNVDSRYHLLTDYLEYSDYEKLVGTCSYAIFGPIRQQSMSNINMCFFKGIKIFLYSDSLIYKQLKRDGYKVFSIEMDLNEEELRTPLSYNDMIHNQEVKRSITKKNGFKGLNESLQNLA